MKKCVVAYGQDLKEEHLAVLRQHFDVDLFREPKGEDRNGFEAALPHANGTIGASVKLGAEQLGGAANLGVVSSISVGVDNYDIPFLNSRGILLTNTPDVLTETAADTAFALLMAAARRVVELSNYIREGRWQASVAEPLFGTDVHGKRLGIVGFGRIGQAVARRGRFGFGMEIMYHSRNPKPGEAAALGAVYRTLDGLLEASDFVCVTVPLISETERMIGAREFGLMKPSAIFVNISRGRVVDEAAMIEALQRGGIRAAGLDVFEREPLPADSPLASMPNVIATPHIGSATTETRRAMADLAVKNLIVGLLGERPPNLVNPEAWGKRGKTGC